MKKQMFTRRIMLATLFALFACLQSFAGGSTSRTYYSKATATASGEGTVYVSTTNKDDATKHAATSSATQNSTVSSAPNHTYYLFATPAEGMGFVGWATAENGTIQSTDNPLTLNVTANSTTQGSPTPQTRYAIFQDAATFYSTITVNATEGGKVFVATAATNSPEYAATATANQNAEGAGSAQHSYYLYAQAEEGYEFAGWAKTADGEVISDSKSNPYVAKVNTSSTDSEAPASETYYAKFVSAVPHYSKVTIGLNAANDLGTKKVGGKLYVGKTAEEAASGLYEYTSEASIMTYSVDDAVHEYYLYAEPEDGFTFAGWQTSQTQISTSYNSTANPYLYKVTATSTDSENPTAKAMYARFNYSEKPAKVYAAGVVKAIIIEEDGTTRVDAQNSGCMVGITDEASAKTCSAWAEDFIQGATQEGDTPANASTTTYIHFTAFAKAGLGYEFKGFTSSRTGTPTAATANQGETGYYNTSNTRQSFSNTANTPGAMGLEDAPKQKIVYAIFQKQAKMEEPTGTTPVEVTEVTGTTELVEGSESKNFSVDLVLNEDLPYDVPGSDKNAKPEETLKQFVTVTGANGNKSYVASYSLVYESTDLGEGGQNSNDGSYGTLYSSHTIRLFFPYDIKADTYTVHLPYGLYTTVNDNKTPTYEFTISVTENTNTYLTIKKQLPREGLVYTYTAQSQTSQDRTDPENGKVTESNITVEIEFNEVVNSIDQSKASGISLTNTTQGINYRYTNLTLPAQLFGKVDGRTAIAYPELINGSYTMTIPEGLFVGAADKVNEAITINFSVTGFRNATLKPYEMATDQITPKANDMSQKIEKLQDIAISYKGEFGDAKALVGNASGIKVQGYTEVIQGEGEGAKPVRTYYDVTTTPSAKVEDGKLVVIFTPSLTTGMYEVTVPAGLAANMEPGEMTMAEKVNAGYAETPAYSMTFNVETQATATMAVNAQAKWGTFVAPFDVTIPEGVTAKVVESVDGTTLTMTDITEKIPAYTPVLLNAENGLEKTEFKGILKMNNKPIKKGLLTGVLEKTPAPVDSYILQNNDSKVGFYKVAAEGLFVGANRAYLTKPASEVKAFFFDQETATKAIEALTSGKAEIYDLNGRKLNKMQKGINIVNGVKVLVK